MNNDNENICFQFVMRKKLESWKRLIEFTVLLEFLLQDRLVQTPSINKNVPDLIAHPYILPKSKIKLNSIRMEKIVSDFFFLYLQIEIRFISQRWNSNICRTIFIQLKFEI